MSPFADLLEALAFEPQRLGKLRHLTRYLSRTPDPDRGYALGALAGTLDLAAAKPALLRRLVETRVDPVLFALSYDYVGDLAETVALIWPSRPPTEDPPRLGEVVEMLASAHRTSVPGLLEAMLDRLDASGRLALVKLITGGLRVGLSARLARTALAEYGAVPVEAIEEVWHGLDPPYTELFAWLEGRAPPPRAEGRGLFRPVMLAHPLEEAELSHLDPAAFAAEWKWDGIRVQAVAEGGRRRLYARSGDEITAGFPDLLPALDFEGALDGELVIASGGTVRPFADLQSRLNRKAPAPALMERLPAAIIAYDALSLEGEDLRARSFAERRARLETWHAARAPDRITLSPLLPFASWEELAARRAEPPGPAVEGVMLKRRDSPYLAGRVKGHWWKWKRDPFTIDAVLLYAQRGHGKRSSFYSDYTFGVWADDGLVPVGKAYFGFSDAELKEIDRFVRAHTVGRFGPVREVTHTEEEGLVLEIAFEGLQRSARHRSGIAMRFPRVARLRWDKRPAQADRLATLEALLAAIEAGGG
ncbi:MAG: cisplatin damage response ATP-dependent DNA ligase [Alphaproteobacteria bacterium]|nr:cisplatin damage response ATP-dependent DNA ligase [Alphaproteobacteria bacterium]